MELKSVLDKIKEKSAFLPTLFLLLLTSFNSIQAQTKVGVRAGMNFSNVADDKSSTKSIPGIQIGLTADMPLFTNFYLQPAVLYSNKGFKQTDSWFAGAGNDFKVTVSYIEVPLNFIYKPKLAGGKLLIGAGPYVGYGTGGKWKSFTNVTIGDIVIDNYGDAIFKNDRMDGEFGNYLYGKPWDFGANFLVGYELFDKFSVQLNAQLGINDLTPEVSGAKREGYLKNKGLGFSVGYKF